MPIPARLRCWIVSLFVALLVSAAPQALAQFPTEIPAIADTVILLPDGRLLYNDNYGGAFVVLDPATGAIERLEMPLVVPELRNPTLGADGRLWFTVDSQRKVGRYAFNTGLLDLFVMPDNVSGRISEMALGLDGSLWATATDVNRILRIFPIGEMRTYDLPSFDPQPVGIVQGPDGNMWFAERGAKKIGRITLQGAVTEFAVQHPMTTGPSQVARGLDNAVWFASDDGFGRVAMNGEMTLFVTGPQSAAGRLVQALDGSFWLATGDASVTHFTPPAGVERVLLWPTPGASAGLVIDAAGTLHIVDAQVRTMSRIARIFNASIRAGDTTVIEFYNATLRHYFVTANAAEAAGIDAGSAGPGWTRTGESWPAWLTSVAGATEVCRFFGNQAINPSTGRPRGPNSHFYTFKGPECTQVQFDPGWLYEAANRFFLVEPVAGRCPAGLAPIYRVYNNGFAANDSNHRYTVKLSIYNQMVASGWRGEGIVMCAAPAPGR